MQSQGFPFTIFNFKKLPCTGEPGSHVGGRFVAIDEDGMDETEEPEVWLWVEAEQIETLTSAEADEWPAPAEFGSFPYTSGPGNSWVPLGAGDPMFRHCSFQFQSIFTQPPD